MKDKLKVDTSTIAYKSTVSATPAPDYQTGTASDEMTEEQTAPKKPTISPGSYSEHLLQEKWGMEETD